MGRGFDGHAGYCYHPPQWVYQWVDDLFPLTLLTVRRHKQGWWMADYRVLWDNQWHTVRVQHTSTWFMWRPRLVRPQKSLQDARDNAALAVATEVYRSLLLDGDAFQTAQAFIMHDVLWRVWLHGGDMPGWYHYGTTIGDVKCHAGAGLITITQSGIENRFTMNATVNAITAQLRMDEPIQLKMFA